jgi:phage FluMu protein Com
MLLGLATRYRSTEAIMSEERARIELRCSKCDRVLGTLPEDGRLETDLVCPQCGATVKAPGPLERALGGVKHAIDEMTGRDERESRD